MKVNLVLNLGEALCRNANLNNTTKMLYSFVEYCFKYKFPYPIIPRIGEFISLEEFIIEWSKTLDNCQIDMMDNINLLTTCIGKEIKVVNVVHNSDHSVLYCSDLFKLE